MIQFTPWYREIMDGYSEESTRIKRNLNIIY